MNNETILSYINSKDVRNYLREIHYDFSPLQCAYLIYRCKSLTIKQKHDAWNSLISVTEDCPLPKKRGWYEFESLHKMLHDYMEFENRCLSKFKVKEPNTVFSYMSRCCCKMNCNSISDYEWIESDMIFSDYQSCFDYIQEEAAEDNQNFRIRKTYLDKPDSAYIQAEYNSYGEMVDWFMLPKHFMELSEYESTLWCESFDSMWFDIPIPFEKGDIVCDCVEKAPFVLLGTVPWYKKENPPRRENWRDYLDNSDMQAYGYGYDEDTMFLYDDKRIHYLDMEYYHGKFDKGKKILLAYSQFLKEQIDDFTLLKMYRMIIAEAIYLQDRRDMMVYIPNSVWDFEQEEYTDTPNVDIEIPFGATFINPRKSNLGYVNIRAIHNGIAAPELSDTPQVYLERENMIITVSISPAPVILKRNENATTERLSEFSRGIEYITRNNDLFLKHFTDNSFDDEDLFQALRDRGEYK